MSTAMARFSRRGAAFRVAEAVGARVPALLPTTIRHPALLVGVGRSGTTLLLRLLSTHPDVAAYPSEAGPLWLPRSVRDHPRWPGAWWIDPVEAVAAWREGFGSRDAWRLQSTFATFGRLAGGRIFLHKHPSLGFVLDDVLRLLPDVRVLHLVRDGRAVTMSHAVKVQASLAGTRVERRLGGPDGVLERLAAAWADELEAIDTTVTRTGLGDSGRYLEVRYEDLAHDLDDTLAGAARFLGVDPGRIPLGDLEAVRPRGNERFASLRPDQRDRVLEALGPALAARGYR